MAEQSIQDRYFELLRAYVARPGEKYLLRAADLGRELVLAQVPPEVIAELQEEALIRLAEEIPNLTPLNAARLISAPLMEMLMAYGLAFREQLESRKRVEQALRKSEERYRYFVQQTAEGFYRIESEQPIPIDSPEDEQIRLMYEHMYVAECNDTFARMYGFAKAVDMVGTRFVDLHGGADIPENIDALRSFIHNGYTVIDVETQETDAEGHSIWFLNNAVGIVDNECLLSVWGTQRDITERKRAERLLDALNQAALAMERALTHEEIFAAVAEELKRLGFSCVLFPTDESQQRLFPKYLSYEARALQALENLTGLKAEHFSISIEDVDVYRQAVRGKTMFVENAQVVVRQMLPGPAKRLAGQVVRILRVPKSIVAPLIVENEVIGLFAVQSDDLTAEDMPAITAFAHQVAAAWRKAELMQDLERSLEELKITQAQLLQARKLESLGRLAGGIAHDFNNLLTTMRGYASFVLMDTAEDDPRRQDLQRIITAVDRAAGLTRQLTLFSRGGFPQRQPLHLNHIVQETYELLQRTLPRTIEVELLLEPEIWTIEADPSQMSQVLINLCINASDAMPDGGVLTLETHNVILDEEYARTHIEARPASYVCLSVSDTGVGMSEEVQAHIFEPFFTTKKVGEGIGLGLATVYGIVKEHDGFITVYSEVGKGSTFHIYLPATEQRGGLAEKKEVDLPRGTETVLLVDDEKAVLELGRSILERCGYTVLVAQNGAEALEVYQERGGEIALVVLDMVTPKMDGRVCLRRLLKMDPEARVLIATGYTVNISVHALLREGALGVVEKPYGLYELSIAVRKALDADHPSSERRSSA